MTNGIPIHAPEKIDEVRPDYIFILPWNLRHEICHPLTQGEDPIEVIRKVKNKNRGRVRKEALNRGEWDEDAESKVGEWE